MSRDFETLQVTLLHADEFCAYDKDDKITNLRCSRESVHRRSAPDQLMIKDDNRGSNNGPTSYSEFQSPMLRRRQTYASNSEVGLSSRRSRSLASMSFTSNRRWSLNTSAGRSLPTVPSASPAAPPEVSQTPIPNKPAVSRYADASVQTEEPEIPASDDDSLDERLSTTSMYQLTAEISRADDYFEMRPFQNPVRIGAMSMFFRTPGYRLGDALL